MNVAELRAWDKPTYLHAMVCQLRPFSEEGKKSFNRWGSENQPHKRQCNLAVLYLTGKIKMNFKIPLRRTVRGKDKNIGNEFLKSRGHMPL